MKLNIKRTFLVGLAFLIISMFWQIYDGVMSIILVNNFGLNQASSGILLALDNILALVFLPLFGAWSDKTTAKMGKRKPYILIGTVIAAIIFVALAVVDYYQFQAVRADQISAMLEIKVDGVVTGYYFTVKGVIQEILTLDGSGYTYITEVADKISELRAAYIFKEITQPNMIYLGSFIGILFIVLLAMCSFRTPAVSLMPDVTIKPLRSKANAIINAMGTIGGAISLVLIMVLGTVKTGRTGNYWSFNYILLFAIVAGLMLALLAIFMFLVKEVKWTNEMQSVSRELGLETEEDEKVAKGSRDHKMPKDVKKSFILILISIFLWFFAYNAASSKLTLYAQNILQIENYTFPAMVGFVAALIAFYPIGILSTKIGRKNTILTGIIVLILGFIAVFVASLLSLGWLIYVAMVIVGFGWAAINVNSYPMVVEMSKGPNIGVFTGYYYAASMLAQAVTPVLSGLLMDEFGMLPVLFPYAIFFSIAAFVTMLFVKHGEPKRIDSEPTHAPATSE
ncbi:MAG: MFS transporter [Bacilli bacterium]|jgi:MFS family permease